MWIKHIFANSFHLSKLFTTMKSFFKTILAVLIGMFVFFGLGFLFLMLIVVSANSSESTVNIESNSILKLDLNYGIPEQDKEAFDYMAGLSSLNQKSIGLNSIVKSIEQAATDDRIKGIYIPLGSYSNGLATTEAIRHALIKFQESEKFIVAYGDYATQKSYYLSSMADGIYMNPEGGLELKGFGSRMFYLKNGLDKLGVQVQEFHRGSFKSAIEPFVRDHMSDSNRVQMTVLLTDVYNVLLDNVSKDRKIERDSLNTIINNFSAENTKEAAQLKIIDATKYYDEVLGDLAARSGLDKADDPKFVSLANYASQLDKKVKGSKIGVVYAQGDIVDGKGTDDNIGGDNYAKIIRKLRKDDDVKAVVLRVNSGGGSALASEVIWREVTITKEVKPVIVSFGDVAASGGYYISCNANRIFCEPNTITGSIGVFGMIPNFEKMLNDKLGINFDEVEVTEYGVFGGGTQPLNEREQALVQKSIDSVYQTFLTRVADGRGKSFDYIQSNAEGRVWSGNRALEIGLVDEIGGLDNAIAYAAKEAGLNEYYTKSYPENKSFFEKITEEMEGKQEAKIAEAFLGDYAKYLLKVKELQNQNPIQARMPYVLEIN